MKKQIMLSLLAIVMTMPAFCQNANTFSTDGWWKPAGPKFSPVVNDDRTVTFRLHAPDADNVELLFDEWDVEPREMTINEKGTWEITIGPVEPRVYQYKFRVDGLEIIDLVNPDVKAGTMVYGSVVEVDHAQAPRFDQQVRIGGDVNIVTYGSTPMNQIRQAWIYTPPGYSESHDSYPVLYLRHGGGDNESSWIKDGRAAIIMDNLIAEGKAVPMIVVMTYGLTDGSWAGGSTPDGIATLEEELLTDIIPLVESRYRVKSSKNSRSIAGLSMGGGQAYVIGLRNPDKFSSIGQFSAGILSDDNFDYDKYVPGMIPAAGINNAFELIWISCGTKDSRYQGHLNFSQDMIRRGIDHEFHDGPWGHEWQFWRIQLHDFAQRIFK